MVLKSDDLDKIAQNYHLNTEIKDKFIEDIGQQHSFKWLLKNLGPTTNRVLELGYGDGIITQNLVDSGYQPHVVEGASSLVHVAQKKHGSKITIDHGMFESFKPNARYHRIIASHVLEHVDDPRAMMRLLGGWLEPHEGRILILVPNSESIHRRLAVLMGLQPRLDSLGARDLIVGHQRVYNVSSLCEDVISSGFKIESVQGFFLKTLPNSMMLGYTPELLEALHSVSDGLPAELCANIGVVARLDK
jgi:2-polyprenyl-3-methyl-5-hydroxy-6-metoxy-1,4-benzoquinol methylase